MYHLKSQLGKPSLSCLRLLPAKQDYTAGTMALPAM
jgi:hypothetical protein